MATLEIIATPNEAKNGFKIESEYHKSVLKSWFGKYPAFKITPIVKESGESRRYLEGAVITAYCKWQYGIDPREPSMSDTRRYLFKRDFSNEIVKQRDGTIERVPTTSKGKAREILDTYTRWAEENGAPIPNPDLYKKWRDEWSMDKRWPTFYDWLDALGIEEDAMPSAETINQLRDSLK